MRFDVVQVLGGKFNTDWWWQPPPPAHPHAKNEEKRPDANTGINGPLSDSIGRVSRAGEQGARWSGVLKNLHKTDSEPRMEGLRRMVDDDAPLVRACSCNLLIARRRFWGGVKEGEGLLTYYRSTGGRDKPYHMSNSKPSTLHFTRGGRPINI